MWLDHGIHSRHIFAGRPKLDGAANLAIMALLVLSYLLALAGACLCWRVPIVGALAALLVLRTGFITSLDLPDPRYMLVLFPAVFALAGCGMAVLSSVLSRLILYNNHPLPPSYQGGELAR